MSNGEHLSKQYDQELEALRARILHMGGLVPWVRKRLEERRLATARG